MKLEKRDGGCEMFDIMTMAENIKTYRNKRGLNQYEFAEKLGISPQAVSKWECGQSCPSIENLCVISEILDVSIDTLIGENSDSGVWKTNIFGKSVGELMEDGIRSKIMQMDDECQLKLQDTMQKIVNDSNGGMICIII